MLLFIFQAGGQTYGLDARNVIQVAPYPVCTPLPHAPAYVAGAGHGLSQKSEVRRPNANRRVQA